MILRPCRPAPKLSAHRAAGLKKELLRNQEQFISTIAERLMMFALGRNLQYYDAPQVRAIVHGAAGHNNTFASLVTGVVASPPFQ